jgi:hypothetical protein
MAKKSYKEEYTPMRPQEERPQATQTTPEQTRTAQTTPEQTQEIVSPYAMHMQELGSIGAQQEVLQAKYDARQAKINDMQKRINEAKANKMSVLSALVEKQKPVYDEKKEKRMRNRAMIQAFGDVLAEASKGYFAYNKRGAGVVPKNTPSNALEEVNKISKMQKKYLDEKKAWDTLNMDWQAKKAQADIDAAEALLTKEEKYQDKIEDRIEKLRERGIKITDDIRNAIAEQVMKEYNDAREIENEIAKHEEMKRRKLGQYAPSKARSGGGGGSSYAKQVAAQKKAADNEKLKVWGRVYAVDPQDMLNTEKERAISEYDNDIRVAVFSTLLSEGLSQDEALRKIENIGDEDILLEYYTEWANGGGDVTLSELMAELSDTTDFIKSFYGE